MIFSSKSLRFSRPFYYTIFILYICLFILGLLGNSIIVSTMLTKKVGDL